MTGSNRDAGKAATTIRAEQQARGVALPFEVVSNPDSLKDGSAMAEFQKPDRIVVMDLRSAELTKYAANAMLANLAERVRIGIGSDPRMGSVEAVNQFQKQRLHRLISARTLDQPSRLAQRQPWRCSGHC
jgi:UDP-glucose 6-dehydrogenase